MRIGTTVSYSGRPDQLPATVAALADDVAAGAGIVYVPEVYTFDAPSLLGFLAASLPGVELGSDVLPIYTRTPALTAMTAAGIDALTGGRFTLGLGASGPQVVEGFHGVRYDAPVARTREVVEICRAVWRRERVEHQGAHYSVPLSRERGGSGLGKPLKIINEPVRERIPVMVAAMGPKNVEMAAEVAEQWAPFFYRPEGADDVWGEALRAGASRRDPSLGPLGVVAPVTVAITEDADAARRALDAARPQLALYVGGMGARGANFYYDLVARYGYGEAADAVQELFLAGRRDEAAAALPEELLRTTSLVGPPGWVAERVAQLGEAGVTTLVAAPAGGSGDLLVGTARTRVLEALAELARSA